MSQYQAGLTLVGAGGTGTNLPMHNPTMGGINAANKFNTISNVHKRGGGGGIGWNRSLLQEEQVESHLLQIFSHHLLKSGSGGKSL